MENLTKEVTNEERWKDRREQNTRKAWGKAFKSGEMTSVLQKE